MKPGTRALGVAESYRGETSTLAGAVVRADRALDGLAFGSCTVGGRDATGAVCELFSTLDREDVRYVLVSGIAPAWFNVLDLHRIHEHVSRPVCSVSFEASPGLENALRREFSGEALDQRLETYERQPPRHGAEVNGHAIYWRALGIDGSAVRELLSAFTPEGGRPEPLRVARIAARAADVRR
jgi:endonuclease V-like protein UPF0215 family